jgi:hypothetical protein
LEDKEKHKRREVNKRMSSVLEKLKKFLSSPTGKLVAIGGGVFIVFIFFLILIFFILFRGPSPETGIKVPKTTVLPEEKREEKKATVTVAPLNEGYEVFTIEGFKDPFKPLTTEESTEATTTGEVQVSSLILKGIEIVEGEPEAEIFYNGEIITVQEGDQVGDTPYRVLSIGDDWVKLLYGDETYYLYLSGGIESYAK